MEHLLQRYCPCVLLLGIFLSAGCHGALVMVTPPQDVNSHVGDDVILTCEVEDDGGSPEYLQWEEFISSTQGQRIWISANEEIIIHPNASKYEIVGTYNLRVKDVQFYDGGRYGCQRILEDGAPHVADIMVYGDTECNALGDNLHEGDEGFLYCHVPYGGNFEPEVYFQDDEGDRVQVDITRGRHFVEVTANVTTTWEDHKKAYHCMVKNTDPDYHHKCTSSFDIKYIVRGASITPDKETIYIGEVLNCTAHGNPEPEIKWERTYPADGAVHTGRYLEVTSEMEGYNEWKCVASNTIHGGLYVSEAELEFTVFQATTTEQGPVVGGTDKTRVTASLFILTLLSYLYLLL